MSSSGTNDYFAKRLGKAGIAINGTRPFDIRVNDDRIYQAIRWLGSKGAGEGYMAGWWDCDRLDEFFYKLCRNSMDQQFQKKWVVFFHSLVNVFLNLQTRVRSLAVAEQHYNLGNDLYTVMLGQSMAYTCGYWKSAKTLDEAQYHKFDLICRKLGLSPGQTILELGCGWGTFAKFAAEKYKCTVVAVNISEEQINYGRVIGKNLPITFHLCDYRDSHIYNPKNIPFDHVVTIGLCEHVGYKNYRTLIKLALANLKEEGLFLLHTIGRNETSFFCDPWIRKYVFPNGMLPSIKLLAKAFENHFIVEDLHNFGADYDKTLMAWHRNFNTNWDSLKSRYDQTFYRLWNYYLLGCAGAFRARALQLWQIVLSPRGITGGYESKR